MDLSHSYYQPTESEISSFYNFWDELNDNYTDYKFSPYGSTSLSIPDFISKNIQNIAKTSSVLDFQYQDADGRPDLRQSFIDNFPEVSLFKANGIDLSASNVVITVGALSAISATIESMVGDNEEVIAFEPLYPWHLDRFTLRKNIVLKMNKMVYDSEKNQFVFDFEALKKTLNSKTRLIILCNPNNPNSRVFTKEELTTLSDILDEFPEVKVLEDSAYFMYYKDNHEHFPFSCLKKENFDRCLTVYSGGKMYNITGSRVGFLVGKPELLFKVNNILKNSWMSSSFEQMMMRDNLKDASETSFYEKTRTEINAIGEHVANEVMKYGIKPLEFEGTYFMVLDIESVRGKVEEKYYYSSVKTREFSKHFDKAFCRMLLTEYKVGVLPMSCFMFGEVVQDNFVRISINRNEDDIKLFLSSLEKFKL